MTYGIIPDAPEPPRPIRLPPKVGILAFFFLATGAGDTFLAADLFLETGRLAIRHFFFERLYPPAGF